MKKRNKFFLPPPKDGSDFKELFKRLAAAGAGRPADKDGFPEGPWTPELLTEAICQIDPTGAGIDLRTVQLWFQDNDKGISSNNIRWLARIFGCDDPAATSEWQIALTAAQSQLTAKRRDQKRADDRSLPEHQCSLAPAAHAEGAAISTGDLQAPDATGSRSKLAGWMADLFCSRSSLDLPVVAFAGAVVLGLLSYIVNIHSVIYNPADGAAKQVGFLWAPNWTVLFLVVLPLYLMFVGELLTFWKNDGRKKLTAVGKAYRQESWEISVEAFSYSYWASFLVCLPIASLLQWINECLIPLVMLDPKNFGVDWGRIAIVRSDIVTIPEAIAFTALAYFYMGICFFLFFAGLILICTLLYDLSKISKAQAGHLGIADQYEILQIGFDVMKGIFRCTILGLLIATLMKVQNIFMLSSSESIVSWFVDDLISTLAGQEDTIIHLAYNRPTLYSSLLIVLATCGVFLNGINTTRQLMKQPASGTVHQQSGDWKDSVVQNRVHVPWILMTGVVVFMVANYFFVDAVRGFSIFLSIGVLLAVYALIDPGFTCSE